MEIPTSKAELIRFVEEIKRQWVATIDALIDPLMFVRTDFTISKANLALAKLNNQDIREIINKKCHKIFANRDTPCPGCKMLLAAESAQEQQFDMDDVRQGKFYEVTSQPIFNNGVLDGVVMVYRDRTEAKDLRKQLLQSEKLSSIGLLAGGVAHEINNPLGGILVFSQMLLREMDKKSPHYEDVEEIYNATLRCKSIVENLLEFARTNSLKKDQLSDVNITDCFKTALRFAKVSIEQHRFTIEESYETEDVLVTADRNKLIQLFLNFFQNAFQAMPGGGALTLKNSVSKNNVIFKIIDTGVGIPEEHLARIFDPFFTTKEPGEGTGLGLAICYGIVQDLGGELKVKSTVNEGTEFTIVFPKANKKLKSAS